MIPKKEMDDYLSVVDMRIKIKENKRKLISRIKEDIKQHKEGKIKVFPTYSYYMKEFKISSKKRIKKIIIKELGEEEFNHINEFWKDIMNQKYSKEGFLKIKKIGDYSEELVKKMLEREGWEVFKIFNYANEETKGWLKFNWDILQKRNKKICNILYQLSRWKSCYLPDFICFKKDYFKFVEVKAGTNVKWKKKQIKGIEKLEELGYVVEIIKPEFFKNEINSLLNKNEKL